MVFLSTSRLIYKAILGLLSLCRLTHINQKCTGTSALQSQDLFLLSIPKVRTEQGEKAFRFASPFS